jgi:hypothetical protein
MLVKSIELHYSECIYKELRSSKKGEKKKKKKKNKK